MASSGSGQQTVLGLDNVISPESTTRKSVPSINQQTPPIGKEGVIDRIVICRDNDRVVGLDSTVVEWNRCPPFQFEMLSSRWNQGYMGIVKIDLGPAIYSECRDP